MLGTLSFLLVPIAAVTGYRARSLWACAAVGVACVAAVAIGVWLASADDAAQPLAGVALAAAMAAAGVVAFTGLGRLTVHHPTAAGLLCAPLTLAAIAVWFVGGLSVAEKATCSRAALEQGCPLRIS